MSLTAFVLKQAERNSGSGNTVTRKLGQLQISYQKNKKNKNILHWLFLQ